jgi:serine phosphatase RsbU (regulator of sigma subunit)/Tfp pilus assembly protein PilF
MSKLLPAKYIFVLFFLLLAGSYIAISQPVNADSLEKALSKSTELEQILLLKKLSEHYISNTPEKAIKMANKLLVLAEKYDSTEVVDYCYQILGQSFYFQNNYKKALQYFEKFLENQVKNNNESGLARAYNNLGIVYRAIEDYGKAIEYYEKSLEINKKLNDKRGLSSSYNNLGVLHEYLNLFAPARDYYQKSLDLEMELGDLDGISTSYLNLGGINLKLKKYNQAIEFCERSIQIAKVNGFNITVEITYDILYKIYKETGNYEKSLLYLEKFNELKDSRINEETNTQLAELELKYNSDKHKQEIELLNKQKRQRLILIYFFIGAIIVFILQSIFLIHENRRRRKNNQLLSLQNQEILQHKEEIETQRDEIEAQRDEIQRQIEIAEYHKDQVVKQNKDMTDSIEYAKNIQIALFPDKFTLQKVLNKGFCLFKPKDIVSGDFYWVAQIGNKSIIVAADCTGHGVPGAFMSIIGINFLNEIVFDEHVITPSEILNRLRKKVVKTLVNSNKVDEAKDAIDISLVVIDRESMKLEYAGAYNHLYFIRDHMLEIIRADKMPVGISAKAMDPFTNHEIDLQIGDQFYMFTDGFVDQFGGPQKKKYRIGNLRELLLEVHEKSIEDQKQIIFETFINWRGNQQQVDDILLIGFRI